LCGCYRNGGSEERERDKTVLHEEVLLHHSRAL
jgi:hypothetical protein